MYKGRSVLAVVPARGGSVGVPLKNIHPLLGRPLIHWVGECAQAVEAIDRLVVSTDHEKIAAEAEAVGIAAPFRRPEVLSGHRIGDFDVLHHALTSCEELDGRTYDVVLMLQPTSPLRRPQHLKDAIHKLVDGDFDTVWSVSPIDIKYHPLKQLKVTKDGLQLWDDAGLQVIARQQLLPTVIRNGGVYAFTRDCLLVQKSIYGQKMSAVVIEEPMVSIDTLEDFAKVEAVLRDRE